MTDPLLAPVEAAIWLILSRMEGAEVKTGPPPRGPQCRKVVDALIKLGEFQQESI